MKVSKHILPVIVFAQFCCTTLWFVGNAVITDLIETYALQVSAFGNLTSIVQFGFIVGTLVFAVLTNTDLFSPSKVFLVCGLSCAAVNLFILWDDNTIWSLLFIRFLTGFFLAGIYPVGMKIAADYFDKGLGKSLGFLVGALVLGTAFPHLLKEYTSFYPWKTVLIISSALATMGGLLMYVFVPDGPFRKQGSKVDLFSFFSVFRDRKFRAAAFGYFGHMWELYAFWAFIPVMLANYNLGYKREVFLVPIASFFVISIGCIACIGSGYLAQKIGVKRTATTALFLSCVCCLISPLLYAFNPTIFICFLLFWGMVVIMDSPMFSTLVATHAPSELKGTALTIVNCIGFTITIISIQLISLLLASYSFDFNFSYVFLVLAIGPILGLWQLRRIEE